MKPILEHLPRDAEESFVVRDFSYPWYPTPWHYHPEYEIVLVTESRGKRFIGDRITDFDKGDLALIGPNLPHLYRNDSEYYAPGSALRARSIVIHFLDDSIGKDLLSLPEARNIRRLLDRSLSGIEFTGASNRLISAKVGEILSLNGFERWLKLMEILHAMAESTEFNYISGTGMEAYNEKDHERLQQVFEFAMSHFREDIRLEQAAELASMAPAAFSRYFKYRTRKTFSGFLLELKTGYAAKLLINTGKSVAEICYESGFNNLSNFNRHFKTFYGMQPLQFRKQHLSREE
ncbi:MAG TPA: AraC family transcriptional regulator [Anseongella sp.]|nr:AraC family transcriptional regulator [Anseongella sp.]